MDTETLLEMMKSKQMVRYIEALNALRNDLDAGQIREVDQELFEFVCMIYEYYKFQWDDVNGLREQIMDLLMKHKEVIGPRVIVGIGNYTLGCLEGKYDPAGFTYISGSLEIAAKVQADQIAEKLEVDHPEDAAVFTQYSEELMAIEGAFHVAYWCLRHIGNQHLQVLRLITYPLEPVFKGFVLHALDAFPGDEEVIAFYKDYIAFWARIRDKSDDQAVKDESQMMIDEGQKYLEAVDVTL